MMMIRLAQSRMFVFSRCEPDRYLFVSLSLSRDEEHHVS